MTVNTPSVIRRTTCLLSSIALSCAQAASSSQVSLQPQTVLLDDAGVQVVSVDEKFIILSGATEKIQMGQVLISSQANGFLRRVTGISRSGSNIRVHTEQATLADAYSKTGIKSGDGQR